MPSAFFCEICLIALFFVKKLVHREMFIEKKSCFS